MSQGAHALRPAARLGPGARGFPRQRSCVPLASHSRVSLRAGPRAVGECACVAAVSSLSLAHQVDLARNRHSKVPIARPRWGCGCGFGGKGLLHLLGNLPEERALLLAQHRHFRGWDPFLGAPLRLGPAYDLVSLNLVPDPLHLLELHVELVLGEVGVDEGLLPNSLGAVLARILVGRGRAPEGGLLLAALERQLEL